MADLSLIVGVSAIVVGVALVLYVFAMRTRYHYTSALACPKCGKGFEYKWVPGASFSAVRLGKDRYLRCPFCHGWSTYDVFDTRVQGAAAPTQTQPA